MRSTAEAMAFLRGQAQRNSTQWRALCLKLQRVARGLPAVYPSAVAAQHATPSKYRVHKLSEVRRGMVAYFDDPGDSNPYGHITAVAGRDENGELLHWTNDAAGAGRVSLVRHSFFERYWGDQFQFAATWLNGQELAMGTKQPPKGPLHGAGGSIRDAIKDLDKAIAHHQKQGNTNLVKALKRDRNNLANVLKRFS